MFKRATCPECGRELTGAIEKTTTNNGTYVFIVQRETPDCNWTACNGCKEIMCKPCRAELKRHCCYEGRIVDEERARAGLARSKTT